jgi:hypothetical protein
MRKPPLSERDMELLDDLARRLADGALSRIAIRVKQGCVMR